MPAEPRVVMIGPAFPPTAIGGLQLAIRDVAGQLRGRGWRVELHIDAEVEGLGERKQSVKLQDTVLRSRLSGVADWQPLFSLWHRIPVNVRRAISTWFMPRAYFTRSSENLTAVGALLSGLSEADIVILFIDGSSPGMTAMVTDVHPRVVVASLGGLAIELGASWWRAARLMYRLRFWGTSHPWLFRQARVTQIRRVVFGSRGWQREATDARLPVAQARTIYFGIPLPAPLPRPKRFTGRILWVGRLTPDKGLHLLLRELAAIGEYFPGISLTAIAAEGPVEYRTHVANLVERFKLTDRVTLSPPVSREKLQQFYAEHDILFFFSRYRDPVALTLIEAFAAGLPVVSSQAGTGAALVLDGETCLCYDPEDGASIIRAISRLSTDALLRGRLATHAQCLVRAQYGLEVMGCAWDELLREEVEN